MFDRINLKLIILLNLYLYFVYFFKNIVEVFFFLNFYFSIINSEYYVKNLNLL